MDSVQAIQIGVGFLLVLRFVAEGYLDRLNRAHVTARAGEVPEAFRDRMDPATYRKSVDYTLAKNRVGLWQNPYDLVVLLLVLFSGLLPVLHQGFAGWLGEGLWAQALFLVGVLLLLAVPDLPWEWYHQFHLEERFGFNKSTPQLWFTDRVKGTVLALLIGVPLLALIFKLVSVGGGAWWLYAWGTMMAFQFVMMILAPVLILPLFNKLEPLPEGELRDRLLQLGETTGFSAQTILVMDGSKRSGHSNAFFTGFGRFRKIVLFDTLIEQLTIAELEAVLAHEIGHYKKRHIPKQLVWSAVTSLLGFFVLAQLIEYPPFFQAFGFAAVAPGPGFLVFSLLLGAVTFWTSPLTSSWSRRFEYEADAFAAEAVGTAEPLVGALRKLSEENLSNLTPHPLYSAFFYSHPTLLERESALVSDRA